MTTDDTAGDEHAAAQLRADRLERERYGPSLGADLTTATRNGSTRPRITERQWQSTVVDTAKLLGWSLYHTFDSRRSASGWPDLCLWHIGTGRFMVRELKTDGGKMSAAQLRTLDALTVCGIDAGVWRPVDWPRVVVELGGDRAWPTDGRAP